MRAHLVSLMTPLLVAAALLFALPAAAQAATWPVPTQAPSAATADAMTMDEFENRLMVRINEARVANGLRAVALFDSCTDRLAERWGNHISSTGVFAHRDQSQVIRRCDSSWAGETLVRGSQLTPESMVQLWLDSPGHREIILSTRARRAGVAVVADPQGRLIGVLNLTRK